MKKLWSLIKRNNEFTFIIGLIVLIWYFIPPLLRLYDPQAGEFGIEMLYVPLIAGIFFFIGLLFVWLYIKLVFPKGFKILDDLFHNTEKMESWQKSQVVLRLFGCLVALYAISLLAVTGISAIM